MNNFHNIITKRLYTRMFITFPNKVHSLLVIIIIIIIFFFFFFFGRYSS
jgi:hypothetical protein